MNKEQIIEELKVLNVEFNEDASAIELLQILNEHKDSGSPKKEANKTKKDKNSKGATENEVDEDYDKISITGLIMKNGKYKSKLMTIGYANFEEAKKANYKAIKALEK